MGQVSEAIAKSALEAGAEIACNTTVKKLIVDDAKGAVTGAVVEDGSGQEVRYNAKTVITACNPYHTFTELVDSQSLKPTFLNHVKNVDYSCGSFKINCAVSELPNFLVCPTESKWAPGPQHQGTVHFENTMAELHDAYMEAIRGIPATRPAIEMTVPSAVDNTISPRHEGKHVVQFFVQYAPYHIDPAHHPKGWECEDFKRAFVHRVFSIVDEYCPGFSSSVIDYDALSPLDLERVFGLHEVFQHQPVQQNQVSSHTSCNLCSVPVST
jgi:phytoene dehydrogenase-like protein